MAARLATISRTVVVSACGGVRRGGARRRKAVGVGLGRPTRRASGGNRRWVATRRPVPVSAAGAGQGRGWGVSRGSRFPLGLRAGLIAAIRLMPSVMPLCSGRTRWRVRKRQGRPPSALPQLAIGWRRLRRFPLPVDGGMVAFTLPRRPSRGSSRPRRRRRHVRISGPRPPPRARRRPGRRLGGGRHPAFALARATPQSS